MFTIHLIIINLNVSYWSYDLQFLVEKSHKLGTTFNFCNFRLKCKKVANKHILSKIDFIIYTVGK